MAEKPQLRVSAPALGTRVAPIAPVARGPAPQPFVEAGERETPPSRFTLISRTGEYWSYPYAYVGLVECPKPEAISIHCNCGEVETIEIRGRGLDAVANALTSQRLLAVTESDHADFQSVGTVITEVKICRAESAEEHRA